MNHKQLTNYLVLKVTSKRTSQLHLARVCQSDTRTVIHSYGHKLILINNNE